MLSELINLLSKTKQNITKNAFTDFNINTSRNALHLKHYCQVFSYGLLMECFPQIYYTLLAIRTDSLAKVLLPSVEYCSTLKSLASHEN